MPELPTGRTRVERGLSWLFAVIGVAVAVIGLQYRVIDVPALRLVGAKPVDIG